MISIANQFNELLATRIERKLNLHRVLGESFSLSPIPTTDECLQILKSHIALLETVAFDLRYKFGPESIQDICREFSQQVRSNIRMFKTRIRAEGMPGIYFDQAFESGLSDIVLRSLSMLRQTV